MRPTDRGTRRGPRAGPGLRAAALVAALAAALALAPPAAAQAPPPPPPRVLARVEIGFDGLVPPSSVAPVWVTLDNARGRELELVVEARSSSGRAEERLVLPAGGRQRVFLAVAVRGDVAVSVRSHDGDVAEEVVAEDVARLDAEQRHLLVLDGRSAEQRTGALSRRDDPVLSITNVDATGAPPEPACYVAFGAVALRGVDPDALSADQTRALLELVRNGGTLLIGEVGPRFPGWVDLFERALAGPVRSLKVAGLPARERRVGLGRVLAFADDPLLGVPPLAAVLSAERKQALAALVEEGRPGNVFPRVQREANRGLLRGGTGQGTRLLVLAFVFAYLLAVGPVLGLALRRAPRRRLALVTAGLIASFSLLAAGVAAVVRAGAGVAFVRTVLYVPPQGEAIELGDVTVESGGASRYRVSLAAPRLAASLLPSGAPEQEYIHHPVRGWTWGTREPLTVRTRRGDEVSLDLVMSPWDRQSVATHVVAGGARPLAATARRTTAGCFVTVRNTTGEPLRRPILVEEGQQLHGMAPFARLRELAPGEEQTIEVAGASLPVPRRRDDDLWPDVLDVPALWVGWVDVAPVHYASDALSLRYVVASRVEPLVRADGHDLTAVYHGLRLDPVRFETTLARGYVGVVVETEDRWGEVLLVVRRVFPGSPAAQAGLTEGSVVVRVDGRPVPSVTVFRTLVGRHLPGETVSIEVWPQGSGTGGQTLTLRLAPRDVVPEGD